MKTIEGTICIDGDRLISKGELKDIWYRNTDWEVEISKIKMACALVGENKNAYLYLYGDDRDQFIPVVYHGFREVYSMLSTRFGFDDELFWKVVTSKEKRKEVIWRKPQETYQILDHFTPGDYEKGLEIQSPEKEFISWDATYDELRQHPLVKIIHGEYSEYITFRYPVRIGRLLIWNLKSIVYERTDVAVRWYTTDCYNKEATDGSFRDLYTTMLTDLGREGLKYEREYEDERRADFECSSMRLSLCYKYDGDYTLEKGFTDLRIENMREYSALLIDESYEKVMEVSDSLIIESEVKFYVEYKKDKRVKRRPPLITERFVDQTVIWRDDVNEKIGFADATYSLVFDKQEIISFTLGNLIPAKGSGGSSLTANLSGARQWSSLFSGEYRSMNDYVERIATVTGKEVILDTEYSDC
ncbi:hypothetical protein M2459_001830 [Parabacteroides sp. PF5-5]|uniref:hypothetical protein n=1 Tax=unclassified Parabacteroides TaxID=2649774 RepID=UPI0024730299|nr:MULTISPECIES: hypothetical protein [unclassified Parabacteroides]MDH6305377.1 hypothetical protein [Parabacteroides sp. PH5-39]MDH6316087.1 hypothetical protein [Parabacteroides sp. PF5-13]MDH6320237.1 hypothetical protein [Parabacteroides sp. PH5-13]MDH6323967.1 hypothetical protein [Parabacteroides sp. PH5-8]MDH6327278.1 hypothetical protein [Parabacteroides sp. PH5-41]